MIAPEVADSAKDITGTVIKCSECGKDISDKAAVCIGCGAPVVTTQQVVPPILYTPIAAKDSGQEVVSSSWFYAEDGKIKGPISESELIGIIKSKKLSYGSSIWRKGFPDWMKIENTELGIHLEKITTPPPLSGEHVNNTIIWALAFAPILGLIIAYFVSLLTGNLIE